MVVVQGYLLTETVRNIGINHHLFGRWIAKFKVDPREACRGNGKLKPQKAVIRKLQKALKRVTVKADILKVRSRNSRTSRSKVRKWMVV
jgi:hypothetical protein